MIAKKVVFSKGDEKACPEIVGNGMEICSRYA